MSAQHTNERKIQEDEKEEEEEGGKMIGALS
jgi:hypothetical protein